MQVSLRQFVSPFSMQQANLDWHYSTGGSQDPLGILGICFNQLPREIKTKTEHHTGEVAARWQELGSTLHQLGGAMVRGTLDQQGAVLEVETYGNPYTQDTPPSHFWRVTTFGEAHKTPLLAGGPGLRLELGEQIILPMCATDEQQLTNFMALLECFPAEERMAFFHGLRQPDLETRVQFMERAMKGGRMPAAEVAQVEAVPPLNPTAKWKVPAMVGGGLVLLILVALLAFLMFRKGDGDKADPGKPTATKTEAAATTETGVKPEEGEESGAGSTQRGAGEVEPEPAGGLTPEEAIGAFGNKIELNLKKQNKGDVRQLISKAHDNLAKEAAPLGQHSKTAAMTLSKVVAYLHGVRMKPSTIKMNDFPWDLARRMKRATNPVKLKPHQATVLSWQFCQDGVAKQQLPGFQWWRNKMVRGQKKAISQISYFSKEQKCDAFIKPEILPQVQEAYKQLLHELNEVAK